MGCGQRWLVANTFSLYEQQTIESCPCPHCGAYTLCCQESEDRLVAEKGPSVRSGRRSAVRV